MFSIRHLAVSALALWIPAAAPAGGFPAGFRWCVSTSAHQIEGYNRNSDWWAWEKIPGKIKGNERSGAACDHWNRFPEDIRLMDWLGVDTYRMSVEWAKIEPAEGKWNVPALIHYVSELALLRNYGIRPLVTLHHFTLPRWLQEKGGWEWDEAPARFERFTRVVLEWLGPLADTWVTINEPMVHLVGGYLAGLTPPGRQDPEALIRALRNLLRSHALAYHAIHEAAESDGREVSVGLAHHLRVFSPLRGWNPLDQAAAMIVDEAFNWAKIRAVESGRLRMHIPFVVNEDTLIPGLKGTQDYLGLNYYTRDRVSFDPSEPLGMKLGVTEKSEKTDLGWEIYPEGFGMILRKLGRDYPGLPILITENGLADRADTMRVAFMEAHLNEIRKAIQNGVRIEGYCHWSLLDNFEWVEGFGPRFGLFEMNYHTQQRKPRGSARWYRSFITDARTRRLEKKP